MMVSGHAAQLHLQWALGKGRPPQLPLSLSASSGNELSGRHGPDLAIAEEVSSCQGLQDPRVRHDSNALLGPLQDVLAQLLYPPVEDLCTPMPGHQDALPVN